MDAMDAMDAMDGGSDLGHMAGLSSPLGKARETGTEAGIGKKCGGDGGLPFHQEFSSKFVIGCHVHGKSMQVQEVQEVQGNVSGKFMGTDWVAAV